MHTTKINRLLVLLALATVVFLFTRHAPAPTTPVCEKQSPAIHEAIGNQLLWESLSRQFVSIKAY